MPIAKADSPLSPAFEIFINGSPLPVAAEPHVLSVVIEDSVELPSMFALEFAGSEAQKEEMPWVDDDLFAVGGAVTIKMGFANELEALLIGEITNLEPEFAFDRLPSLMVRGYDLRHRLHHNRKTRTFVQQKDSDIAGQIAGTLGLTAQVTDSLVIHDYVLQANQTDMEFLHERARRIHYEVVVEDKTLFFRPVGNAQGAALTLTREDDLLEFYPRLSSLRQVSEVTIQAWNPKDKKPFIGKAKTGDEVATMGGQNSGGALMTNAFGTAITAVTNRPIMTQAEADQLAKARFNDVALALICGEGVSRGRTDLRAGKVIKIGGIGKRFSGHYYVMSTTHRYSPHQGYFTHFTFRRNAS